MNPSKRYSGLHVAARGAIAFAAVASFLVYQSTSIPARAADSAACPAPAGSLAGSGTQAAPWLIDDSADLQLLRDDTTYWDDSLVQTANIDMGNCVWDHGIAEGGNKLPVGYRLFSGVYDGDGHQISGLDVSSNEENVWATGIGLFGTVSGTIRDLGFDGQVSGTRITDGAAVGGLVGWLNGGTIERSYAAGDVTSVYTTANTGTGGLVGRAFNGATITDSHAAGNVTSKTISAGLVGYSEGSTAVLRSYATGDVLSNQSSGSAGGLVGYLLNGTVEQSYATGNVSGVAQAQHLGALVAAVTSSTVVDSFATGAVSGWTQSDTTYGQVGGLIGDATAGPNTITRAYAATAGMTPGLGGDDTSVGGVAGVVSSTTWNSVAWNSQTAAPSVVNPIGSTPSVAGVSGFNTSQLKTLSTFTDPAGLNWNAGGAQNIASGGDPSYTWGICAAVNNGYPFLTGTYAVNPCASAPTAPQNPVATGGNASATVTWAAPVSDGGSALTGYTVTASPGGQTCTDDTVAPLSCVVTGLTNGTSYTFDVTATNGVGTSSAATSNAVTPSDPTPTPTYPPSEPLNVAGVAGDASAVISWSPPASSGSFAVTDYQVVVSPGGQSCTAKAPSLTCTITGLTNGESYTVIVRALNGAGWGGWSDPSASFTPVDPVTKTIVITGTRVDLDGRRGVRAFGETTGLAGARVQARVHLSGEVEYYDGSRRTVADDGTFTWQRLTNKKVYVYFRTLDQEVRSNRIVISIE